MRVPPVISINAGLWLIVAVGSISAANDWKIIPHLMFPIWMVLSAYGIPAVLFKNYNPRFWFLRSRSWFFLCDMAREDLEEWCKEQLNGGWQALGGGCVYIRREQDAALFKVFFHAQICYEKEP